MQIDATRLSDLLERAARGIVPRGWLYLPNDWRVWNADTPAYMVDDSDAEDRDEELSRIGYCSTIDAGMIEDLGLASFESFNGRLEALIYYVRFDAFLPAPGAPDPPPPAELLMLQDRRFYYVLGDEREDVRCQTIGCSRGAVRFSVMCKAHHFEQVKRRPCPFNEP